MYVYVSGGSGRESLRDCLGNRLTKKQLGKLLPSRFVLQKSPNRQTQMVILPDGVRYMSKTTFSKLRPGASIRLLSFSDFQRRYLR